MKMKAKVIFLCTLLFSVAQQAKEKTDSSDSCYLPSKSNVSYSDVAQLSFTPPDKTFSYGEDPLQRAEVWFANPIYGQRAPVVVLIHGGCWLNAFDIQHTYALSTALRNSGYAVWSLEYRRTGDDGGGWPGSFEDILAGINSLINNGSQTVSDRLDRRKISLIGHSAGGHLALLAGNHYSADKNIRSVIGLAAIVDLNRYAEGNNSCESATPKFMGGSISEIPDLYENANPALKAPHPRTYLLHGELDSIVSPAQSKKLPGAIVKPIPKAGHFDMVHPETLSFQSLLSVLGESMQ